MKYESFTKRGITYITVQWSYGSCVLYISIVRSFQTDTTTFMSSPEQELKIKHYKRKISKTEKYAKESYGSETLHFYMPMNSGQHKEQQNLDYKLNKWIILYILPRDIHWDSNCECEGNYTANTLLSVSF